MLRKILFFFILINLVYGVDENEVTKRDTIIITGSTTVLPFAMAVSERFANKNGKIAPKFLAKGSISGFSKFCKGESDINMASRSMGMKQRKACQGVQYIEIPIGYDAIALIIKKGLSFNVTRKSLYYALAEFVPVRGKLMPNDILFWRDVLKEGYSGKIRFYGPSPSSGTLLSFIDLVMYYVGNKLPTLNEYRIKSTKNYVKLMTEFRQNVWTQVSIGELEIIKQVIEDEGAIGVVGYNYYLQSQNILDALSVDGFAFNNSNLKTRRYPLIRPLYLYVNVASAKKVVDIGDFIVEFFSDEALGSQGYLTQMGLLQLTQDQLEVSRRFVRYIKRVESLR